MIEDFYNTGTYSLAKQEKSDMLTKELLELTQYHIEHCEPYANILKGMGFDPEKVKSPADIPFYPVRLFKEMDLLSIPREEVFKTMTSSGTTGQAVSKIFVDRDTAMIQQKVLLRILSDYIGKKRIPLLVIDTPAVMKDRKSFTARGAALIGLQMKASCIVYALNDDMSLNKEVVRDFLAKYGDKPFLIFGFTFLVWQHLYQTMLEDEEKFDMSNGWLMTGGGWKKLISQSISQEKFHEKMKNVLNIEHFLDHYAMVEQSGCIYAECECGHLHASIYSDVFVRNPNDMTLCEDGEEGIIQVVSVLPHSYPGHSLLTEDKGVILGEDDCPCGRKGKYIKIIGRIKNAELRGCSDTYGSNFK